MRDALTFVILCCSLALVSCARHDLPPVKNAEALRADSRVLFGQFPVSELPTNVPDYGYQCDLGIRIIPRAKWPPSILALHPHLVCSYQGGIEIWISELEFKDRGKWWEGYYVVANRAQPPPPQAASNHFVFKPTDLDSILLLKQTSF